MVPGWSGFLGNRLWQGAVPRSLLPGVFLHTMDHKEHLVNLITCITTEELYVNLPIFIAYWGLGTISCKPFSALSLGDSTTLPSL